MNWISLQSGRQPKYEKYVYLCVFDETTELIRYSFGKLKEVKESASGKICMFSTGNSESGEEVIESNFTHYCIPTPPKKKA